MHPQLRPKLLEDSGALRRHVHVFVDGRDVQYVDGGLDHVLRADTAIDIFPAVGGG
jgi:molybdopterin converting factor small subunit